MSKLIRIFRRTAMILCLFLFLVPVSLYFTIQLPAVQTMLVHLITNAIQKKLPKSTIAIGSVHYSFFNKLVIKDIYASDIHGDTLLYVQVAAVNVQDYSIVKKQLTIGSVNLYSGVFNLYDGPQTNNINEVLNELPASEAASDTNSQGPGIDFNLLNLKLSDFRFTYRNLRNPTNDPDPAVIDFKNLALSQININIKDFKIERDTIFFEIKNISLYEKSGYRIRRLSAKQAYCCADQIMLKQLIIDDEHSYLRLNHYAMNFSSRYDFENYPEKIVMDADFNNALFSLGTIRHFTTGLRPENIRVYLYGKAGGTVNNLRSSLLSIAMDGGNTTVVTSFKMAGLPAIDSTSLRMRIQELNTNSRDLSHMLHEIIGPGYGESTDKMIRQLGNIRFKGDFDGMYNDFVAHGAVNTAIGGAAVDMLFHPTENKSFTAEGEARVTNFNVGKFTGLGLLGEASANADVALRFNPSSGESFQFTLNGAVPKLEFNGYAYSNLEVNGTLSDRDFRGKVVAKDPNLDLQFDGYIAYNKGNDTSFTLQHQYSADIRHADLHQLHFNTRDTVSQIKGRIEAMYEYRDGIDQGKGKLSAINVFYRDDDQVHHIGNIDLIFDRSNEKFQLKLNSGFADARFEGPHSFFTFIDDLKYTACLQHLPLLGDTTQHSSGRTKDYNFTLDIKHIEELSHLISKDLIISNHSWLEARLTPENKLSFDLRSPFLALGADFLKGVNITGQTKDTTFKLELRVNKSEWLGLALDNISTDVNIKNNLIETYFNYKNNSSTLNYGGLHVNSHFTKSREQQPPIINFDINASELVVNDTAWTISPAKISIDGRNIRFDTVSISNLHQSIMVNGALSPSRADTFAVRLNNFDLSNLNTLTGEQGYQLQGILSGNAKLTGVYDTLMFYADFKGRHLVVNKHRLGMLDLQSNWDKEAGLFRLAAEIRERNRNTLQINGVYKPAKDSLHLTSKFDHFRLVHMEPLVSGVLSNIGGFLSGEVTATGSLKAPQLHGEHVMADSLGLTVDYLNTHYTLTAPIDITPTHIRINNATLFDGVGGLGTLNGTLQHTAFRKIKFNIGIESKNLLCMNTTIKHNELFYGKAYATGNVAITGNENNIHFDITATTNPHTICHIPLSSSSKAKESNMLAFKAPAESVEDRWLRQIKPKATPGQRMTVDIHLQATPDAEVQIIFDEKSGDIVRGRGKGNLRLSIDPAIDKFDLYGDYAIDQGDYFFTMLNIISKKFIIEQGSNISFNGDIRKSTLDIMAMYKTKAALNTLTEDTSSVGNVRRAVDCRIHIAGNLFSPILGYKVDVQNLDPSTRAKVEAAMNTEEKMTRQFISLLAFGSFMPEEQSGISSINLSASASELLSNQLSNMLTQLNIPFDVGFVYNTSATTGATAFDVAVSTQLFNDRVSVNGAFGNNTRNYSSNFTGDLDIELKFDKQGRFRGKAFTHSADQFTDQLDNSQRSGVGFIYQEDFNSFKELFERWFGKKKKKN